ncbi:MAG TPA: serine hydrolase [Candidatus Kapabacteria bacterium]|nr:serine hydrolase [Candidatus Kapabacteria bacterium]
MRFRWWNTNSNDPSDRWRERIGTGSIVFLLLVALGTNIPIVSAERSISDRLIDSFNTLRSLAGKSGGDVTVQPPVIPPIQLPVLVGDMLDGAQFTAASMIVKDHETGAVLFRKNEYVKRPIASVTKLMSALVVLEKQPVWTTSTQVVADDLIDTHMYAGDTYTLGDLWQAALIGSSNKAIMTLADAVGWPRPAFVERMNQKAVELGMTDTQFTEPTGLDEGNVSTASDLAQLLSSAVQTNAIRDVLVETEKNLYSKERKKQHHLWSTNWLLLGWIPNTFHSVIGKTGFITSSNYNFVAQITDAKGRVLDVVVLGAGTHEARFTEARDIANWVFEHYRWPGEETATTTQM